MPARHKRSSLSVIIVGSPRSGTYWVVDLLQTRLGIPVPTETHFFPLFKRFLWLWGDLSRADNRRRLLQNIYEFIAAWTVRSSVSEEYRSRVRGLSLLATIDENCVDDIINESWDYPSLVEALYRHFAKIHGAEASGDKSAHYQVIDPGRIFSDFPDAKMLHVVRDGRDVALSWLKEWFGPPGLAEAARNWRDHVEVNRDWGRRNSGRYLELRYEDIASDRESQICRLEEFLGVQAIAESGEGSALADLLSTSPSHIGMKDIVAQENVAKWKNEMLPEDVAKFERIAGATLVESGYELEMTVAPNPSCVHLPIVSVHGLRVVAKSILPLILGICTRLHIPILRLVNRGYASEWRRVGL